MICLLLQNVPRSMSESHLRWLCNFFGPVHSVCVMKHLFTDEANGLAMIQMNGQWEGRHARDALDGWVVEGHCLSAALYPSPVF
jgi:hypothetical protein